VLIGEPAAVREKARSLGVDLGGVELRDPATDPRRAAFEADYVQLRQHKGVTPRSPARRVGLPHYFAALAVRAGEAVGFVSGLNSDTKPFIPAFEIVKMRAGMKPGVFRVRDGVAGPGVLLRRLLDEHRPGRGDTRGDRPRQRPERARLCHEPRVAFLSFSTRDSAKDPSIDRVKEAVALVRQAEPGCSWTARCSSTAAFLPEVAKKKCPDSPSRGAPTCSSSPTSTRATSPTRSRSRLGGARAIGPVFQGLNKPVNDVSRGCSVQDFADVAAITALQAMG